MMKKMGRLMSVELIDRARIARFLYWFDVAFMGGFLLLGGLPIAAFAEVAVASVFWYSILCPMIQRSIRLEVAGANPRLRLASGLQRCSGF